MLVTGSEFGGSSERVYSSVSCIFGVIPFLSLFFDQKRKEETKRVTGSLEAEPVCTSLFIYFSFLYRCTSFAYYIMYLSVV